MKKAISVLSGLAAVSLSFISASATAGAIHAFASPNGMTTISPSAAAVIPQSQVPDGLKDIYTTFNSDVNNAYDCCSGWTISAPGSIIGAQQDVAMPFTPGKAYIAKKITVAVGYVTGTNGVTVSLNSDAGGAPGAVLKKTRVTGLPTFGTCCVTATVGAKGTPLAAGTQYWVVVKTDKMTPDTWDAWNGNTIGASGTFAFDTGSGWNITSGTLSAFSVRGK